MERLAQVIDAVTRRIAQVAFWLMLLVVLIGTFNTIARSTDRVLGTALSSNAYLELQWYLFAAIFLLGGAHTLDRNAHVRVDILYDRLGRRARAWIDLIGHLALLLPFSIYIVLSSIQPVRDSWQRWEGSPDPSGLPRYPIKTLIPLAFGLLALQGVSEAIKRWRELREPPEPPAPETEPAPEPPGTAEPAPPRPRVVVVVREPHEGAP